MSQRAKDALTLGFALLLLIIGMWAMHQGAVAAFNS